MNDLELENRIISFRRFLHRIPELDFDLPKTRAYLLSVLQPLGCEIRDLGKAGFTAYFSCVNDARKDGGGAANKTPETETIAFRSDMDAIPITEPAGCDFRSTHEGAMHACGHDGHMGMLLGLALWISENRKNVDKNCLLIFQAAEETTGGAKLICDTGVLRDYGVSRVYGLHLWPAYPAHTIVCRAEEFMAGTFVIDVTLDGRSVHIAEYQNGADALEAGCLFVQRAYELERALPDDVFRLLRFGTFVSGTTNNVVSSQTRVSGAMRAYSPAIFDYFETGLAAIARDIERETGVKISYKKSEGYPAVINPSLLYEHARRILTEAGFAWFAPQKPILQAEDFAYYQRETAGLFMHLGAGGDAQLHSPAFTFDESVLLTGVRVFRTLLTENGQRTETEIENVS